MLLEILLSLSTGILGIFLGSQITEGILFVPYWKTLTPKDFFELHKTYGPKIYQFYAPLTIAATMIPLMTVGYGLYTGMSDLTYLLIMGVFTVLFFGTYFLYFKNANAKFADASIPDVELSGVLSTWGNWHWLRVGFECVAFISAILTLNQL